MATEQPTNKTWMVGDLVQVSLPYGLNGDKTVHMATINRMRVTGPDSDHPSRTVHVAFEDPFVYGGLGQAWVDPSCLAYPGDDPAEAERVA